MDQHETATAAAGRWTRPVDRLVRADALAVAQRITVEILDEAVEGGCSAASDAA
jgi:hypothetical protein